MPLRELFVDDDLVAVDKPPGVSVVPERDAPAEHCLRGWLEAQRGEPLWVVHRLDRDASGVLVFARHAAAHRRLSLAFEQRRVNKRYLAFVHGTPEPPAGWVRLALHRARRGKMRPARPGDASSLEAATRYALLCAWRCAGAELALVEAFPVSGRQHQIRVHLRALGHPIAGDPLYALGWNWPAEAPTTRLALHAQRLEVPGALGALVLESPLAPDLETLRAWLAAHAERHDEDPR